MLDRHGLAELAAEPPAQHGVLAAIATSQTGSIAQAKPTNVSPVALNTSRLVRLEIGSSVEPELAMRTAAYA